MTVKQYVSGHTVLNGLHHAKRSRGLLLTACDWQRCQMSKFHLFSFFACSILMLLPYWCIRGTSTLPRKH